MNERIEGDSVGTLEIPAGAYYGVQTLRARQNFPITGRGLNPAFIRNLVLVKKAAALANGESGLLRPRLAEAIVRACDEILGGALLEQFIVDAVQGGAGTSANMNANEVIANRAIELLEGEKGDYSLVSPNDHVNMCQSTNDVIPTAARLTALELLDGLIRELLELRQALDAKAEEFAQVLKIGRTQLQDAVPMYLGQSFRAWSAMEGRDLARLRSVREELYAVNLGGTAVGTSINAFPDYLRSVIPTLSRLSGRPLRRAEDLFDATQNLDSFAAVSCVVKTCALNLSKMCSDLRLLSSGPRAGLGEISLPARQNGSSIMPGKVNPVIPEVVNQAAFLVAGNDTAITMAAEAGQMELNAFGPVLFDRLFESVQVLTRAVGTLRLNCVEGIQANQGRCRELLDSSVGIITVLCPYLGYRKAAQIAKTALSTGASVRELVLQEELTDTQELLRLLEPAVMAGSAAC
ncbi:Aspartate ammonia-lyase [bioreactor metagenome]|uniref:Aspartate ammonia-lyase n=1 Tax=bioreactor metagenome TaxID=1076179 RepID=A0A644Z8D8_9ZZZZ